MKENRAPLSSRKPAISPKNSQFSQQFFIMPKTHVSYPQAFKKWLENSKVHKTHRKEAENSAFFKDLWNVQSKKIGKTSVIRRPLSNIANISLINRSFLEDQKNLTTNYEVLSFLNSQTRDLMLFRCFEEKELKIPDEFSQKTITHSLDNDVTTDDEQVKNAINNLKNSLKESLLKKSEEKIR